MQDLLDPDQLVLQFAPEVGGGLLLLEMGEDAVHQEQPGLPTWHRATEARQVVPLGHRSGERGLAALIGARDHQDPFLRVQVEVVAYDRGALGHQLAGQGQIEAVETVDAPVSIGQRRQAERQTGLLHGRQELQVGQEELDVPFELVDGRVDEIRVLRPEVGQSREGFRIQEGHPVQNPRLDPIELNLFVEIDKIGFHFALLELGENVQDPLAEVLFLIGPLDGNAGGVDQQGVAHLAELVRDGLDLRAHGLERAGVQIPVQIGPEPGQRHRAEPGIRQHHPEFGRGIRIELHGLQEPAVLLQRLMELVQLSQVAAHPAELAGKRLDALEQPWIFKVTHGFVAVPDLLEAAQRRAEVRLQVIGFPALGHSIDDLVQVHIGEEARRPDRSPIDRRWCVYV